MRVVLHRLSDDVGHLRVVAVVHPVHRVQYSPLYRFKAVDYVRDGSLKNDVGGVIKEPVLEHSAELELLAVLAE